MVNLSMYKMNGQFCAEVLNLIILIYQSILYIVIPSYKLINQSIKIYIAPLQDPYSEALLTQAKQKRTVLRRWWNWEQAPFFGGAFDLLEVHSTLLDRRRTGLHWSRVSKWDNQITVDRGPQCMMACTRRERAAELAQIGRPARQAPPHQGCDSVRDAL